MFKYIYIALMGACGYTTPSHMDTAHNDAIDYVAKAAALLQAARYGEPTDSLVQVLANAPWHRVQAQLDSDAVKKAFWINLYNAYTIHLLQNQPELYKHRNRFFSRKHITLAGQKLSLDDIEHGILRRYRSKWSMGYWGQLFPGNFIKSASVDTLDFRIHFALNCGAKSCPPIAYYAPEQIEAQLRIAQRSYLSTTVVYHSAKNQVAVPKIFSWFRGDFGGKKGIVKILKAERLIPQEAKPALRFLAYDWSLDIPQKK